MLKSADCEYSKKSTTEEVVRTFLCTYISVHFNNPNKSLMNQMGHEKYFQLDHLSPQGKHVLAQILDGSASLCDGTFSTTLLLSYYVCNFIMIVIDTLLKRYFFIFQKKCSFLCSFSKMERDKRVKQRVQHLVYRFFVQKRLLIFLIKNMFSKKIS